MFRPAEVGVRIPIPSVRPASHSDCIVFKLPAELLFEIFSHFGDHRQTIRNTCGKSWSGLGMIPQSVERSTVIRKLTMTCWALRNTLLPILWRNTEGCAVLQPSASNRARKVCGLYPQCIYLLSNPTVASYVR